MEKEITILLVEDDPNSCQNIIDLVDNSDDMRLVGVTNNSIKAVEYIRDRLPDVVILDLELHKGSGSGLDVLKDLNDIALSKKPYILVATNNSSTVTYELARQLGTDYILSKHQEHYSEKTVIDFLRMLSPVIKSKHLLPTDNNTTEAPEYYEKRMTRRVIAELNTIGISQRAVGYNYLVDAIMITIKQPTTNLTTMIAAKYNKTECSVERAMQNAIKRAWATSNIDDLLIHYTAKINSSKGVPTLTEFVCYYANKIKNEY